MAGRWDDEVGPAGRRQWRGRADRRDHGRRRWTANPGGESTGRWGGTTAWSGGGLWLPGNPLMRGPDSVATASTYLDAVIGNVGPASSPERRRAFLTAVPGVFGLLARLGVRWVAARDYPDYYPDRPGGTVGRAVEVAPFGTRKLGAWWDTCRAREGGLPPLPLMTDDVWQIARAWSTPGGLVRGARLVFRTLRGLAAGKRLVGSGAALAVSLLSIVRGQGTGMLLGTPLTELVLEGGAVTGAVAGSRRIRARAGVVLAAGGFAHNREWRQAHHGIPGYSSAAPGDRGSAIEIARRAGARLSLMDDAWRGSAVPLPDGSSQFLLWERSFPYGIVVDGAGDRFTNESASYVDFGHAMLADRLGMAPERLRATVERFNGFARGGVDEDVGRGRTVYDNYYGDPTVKPNPDLGPLTTGPFTAVKLVPGDLGTKGGLLTERIGS